MATSARRRKNDLGILLITLALGAVLILNAQTIGDWWFFQTYQPTTEITELASAAGMNETGRQLFYRFSPEIVDEQTMRDECDSNLGCTNGAHIYILQSNTQREYERNVVTASHEMLHVAWSRLSEKDKEIIAAAMEQQLQTPAALQTKREVRPYKNDGYLEDYINEAFAYTGSEVGTINSTLENYYSRYFSDRYLSVAAYTRSPEDIE